jgi:transcription antitermination factor NusG
MNDHNVQKPGETPLLTPGKRVRVKAGVLAGVEGVVLSEREDGRLVLTVTLPQSGVSIAMPKSMVDLV